MPGHSATCCRASVSSMSALERRVRRVILASSVDLVWAGGEDLDSFVGLLIGGLELLNELECAHAHDDAAEDHILVVEEGQRGAHRHVELALVGVAQAVSLTHAEHADLAVSDMEGFILEGSPIDGASKLRRLRWDNLAHLDVHALDDAVHLSADVGQLLVVAAHVTLAQAKEVLNGARSDVSEKLKVNVLGLAVIAQGKLGVLAGLRRVDHLAEGVLCELVVDDAH